MKAFAVKRYHKVLIMGRITIQQVADKAGVSPATVSRVLNDKASQMVSEATRERVITSASELGYQPSAAARAMATGRTWVVAIACEQVTQPHFVRMIEAARDLVAARGYHLLLASEAKDHGAAVAALLGQRQADIVLHVMYPVERVDEYADTVSSPRQRLVALGPMAEAPPLKVMSAYWDDRRGIHKAVGHLAGLGHRRVAFLAGSVGRYKQQAFEAASAENGIEHLSISHEDDSDQLAAGGEMAAQALASRPRPTAILARNDQFAIGALPALAAAGLSVPEDISLIGYNDTPVAAYTTPALTTIRTPVVEAAEAVLRSAMVSLDESPDDGQPDVHSFGFDTRLVVRDSTGPPPADHGR